MPKEKAISVAMGMPMPGWVEEPRFNIQCTKAGIAIPPNAARMGSKAFFGSDSSPAYSSLSISNPTIKKNNVMNPSLSHSSTVWFRWMKENDRSSR